MSLPRSVSKLKGLDNVLDLDLDLESILSVVEGSTLSLNASDNSYSQGSLMEPQRGTNDVSRACHRCLYSVAVPNTPPMK